jgi:hypothetical protein
MSAINAGALRRDRFTAEMRKRTFLRSAAKVGFEPKGTDAANWMKVCYHASD